jgi:transposase InsO family protein
LEDVRRIHAGHHGRYGSPRVHAALRAEGRSASRGRVERLMRRHGIRALAGRRFQPCTTDSRHHLPIAPNLLKQAFSALVPNRVWLADITYPPTGEGWLYLAAMLDLATRKVVGPPRPAGRGSCGHGSAVLLTADGRCETTCAPS